MVDFERNTTIYRGKALKDTSDTSAKTDISAKIASKIAQELGIREQQVTAVIELIDGGSTIPFIARYRKEATGALDDETLRALDDKLRYLRNLEDRKQTVLASIEEQANLHLSLRRR